MDGRSGDGSSRGEAASAGVPDRRSGAVFGPTLRLGAFDALTTTNRQFARFDLSAWDRCWLPRAVAALLDREPVEERVFVEDDNRSAVDPEPAATLDGMPFFLSVKGVGSAIDPFAHAPLSPSRAAELADDPSTAERLRSLGPAEGGMISGELWLRGSPYGGQGLPHAMTALRVSERADLTDLRGFRIAPVVKVAFLPPELEDRLRSIYWYRRYRDRFVQELRLVPSSVRFYFHGRRTVGSDVAHVFELFGVDSGAKAHRLQLNFVRSGIALLTLFARTMEYDARRERYAGLDFSDVWLDKDAVMAPDGTAYFVDLEGIDTVRVDADELAEKLDDQIFRSLYEFMFAYEQIDAERARRFGAVGSRRRRFEALLVEALREDPFVRVHDEGGSVVLSVRFPSGDQRLKYAFPLVDRARGEL
ncbi:MAG TPA: hypothetical protein VMH49_02505 [Thermoplasmata archaeon]|nr:hypothetical protein [Thermoplasmata archaeon]